VPRPAVELVDSGNGIKVLGRDDRSIDISIRLKDYSMNKVKQLSHLSGYIFKSRSPSCGVNSTPIFNSVGNVKNYTNGIFVAALLDQYPAMSVIEDTRLESESAINEFIQSVIDYSAKMSYQY